MPPEFVSVRLGGRCRPCMSTGAATAGSLSVASHPWGGNSAHTPTALDGPTAQSGIFSQRTQLLGQVIISTLKFKFSSIRQPTYS